MEEQDGRGKNSFIDNDLCEVNGDDGENDERGKAGDWSLLRKVEDDDGHHNPFRDVKVHLHIVHIHLDVPGKS